jgi:predicted membrane chloride channel (bestrophin family)
VIAAVAPYLRSYKRHRAALVLDKYLSVTRRNGKYDAVALTAKRTFEDVFSAITGGCARRKQSIKGR